MQKLAVIEPLKAIKTLLVDQIRESVDQPEGSLLHVLSSFYRFTFQSTYQYLGQSCHKPLADQQEGLILIVKSHLVNKFVFRSIC